MLLILLIVQRQHMLYDVSLSSCTLAHLIVLFPHLIGAPHAYYCFNLFFFFSGCHTTHPHQNQDRSTQTCGYRIHACSSIQGMNRTTDLRPLKLTELLLFGFLSMKVQELKTLLSLDVFISLISCIHVISYIYLSRRN